ncbi:hypothetical protein AB4Y32_30900 [Paraburkholderia phymatum]|uniref:Uncharacterized protein n=1 Tax=Paraburkholderia phymatum TaxID=148447 RepID=A0ACC6U9E1_9BURK
MRHYVGLLAALQDDLGWRNDAAVADQGAAAANIA